MARKDWQPFEPRDIDEDLIDRCLELWDQGFNTNDIAQILFEHESTVERALRFGREHRKGQEP
jgi:hypothetical protein